MIFPGAMLKEILCSLFKKPATRNYPHDKATRPDAFRGKLKFFSDKCIGCKICMRDCPSNAIVIHKIADKQFEAEIRLDRCVYCAQCVESCPKKALEATHEFELGALEKKNLNVILK